MRNDPHLESNPAILCFANSTYRFDHLVAIPNPMLPVIPSPKGPKLKAQNSKPLP